MEISMVTNGMTTTLSWDHVRLGLYNIPLTGIAPPSMQPTKDVTTCENFNVFETGHERC